MVNMWRQFKSVSHLHNSVFRNKKKRKLFKKYREWLHYYPFWTEIDLLRWALPAGPIVHRLHPLRKGGKNPSKYDIQGMTLNCICFNDRILPQTKFHFECIFYSKINALQPSDCQLVNLHKLHEKFFREFEPASNYFYKISTIYQECSACFFV